jgi:hypothetical protein
MMYLEKRYLQRRDVLSIQLLRAGGRITRLGYQASFTRDQKNSKLLLRDVR